MANAGESEAPSGGDAIRDPSFSVEPVDGEEARSFEKDPRKIARKYQLELCRKALDENIIVYLGTGSGKTHIAVLLIYELGHLIRKPRKNVCVFLAPSVYLVQQQARVIQSSVDFKVGIYHGNSKHSKIHHDWEKVIEQYEVLVMTPEILVYTLSHCFIRLEHIVLLIFDECHHAQVESNHPYAEIMKVFYGSDSRKFPRIFGMTASPILGKGSSVAGLQALLHAKIHTVEDREMKNFVTSAKIKVYHYGPVLDTASCFPVFYCLELEKIKELCASMLSKNGAALIVKHGLSKLHRNLTICLKSLGLWGALKACPILLGEKHFEPTEVIKSEENRSDNSVFNEYIERASSFLSSNCITDPVDCSGSNLLSAMTLKEPCFSKKFICLVNVLSTFRLQSNMKCIIFVNTIVIARALSKMLQEPNFFSSWKCDFLIGVNSGQRGVSMKSMDAILEKFRSGELNLLVATKAGEEGLDIQACCMVVRFDLPDSVSSYIQSRGRARMPQSEYAFLVDSGSQAELNMIKALREDEDQMNNAIASRSSSDLFVNYEESTYSVDSTLATISSRRSVSLLDSYCSKLPHDEYFNPLPQFSFFDTTDGIVCHIILPANSPIYEIDGTPQLSQKSAKRNACLKACETLHKLGALNSYLLPAGDQCNSKNEELMLDSSGSVDDESRGALHEMLIPAALKEPWSKQENPVNLNSYYIKFNPIPEDRLYMKFGLFLKALLPEEAERMEVKLQLSRGRSVLTELVPSGPLKFHYEEILLAQGFQEIFLKMILDRSEFIPEFVSLSKSGICGSGTSTFYLLLPVILDECRNTIVVNWKTVRRFLSSPIFRTPPDVADKGLPRSNDCLQLKNGCRSVVDIKNSLVYAPYKAKFFFISAILYKKNGYSKFNDSVSHAEHLNKMFNIQLSYPLQPLLHAKQLFSLRNLLHDRKNQISDAETHELEEHFFELAPEVCELKVIGFSKDIGSSVSLLPSLMHHLESLLLAVELKSLFSGSFPEGTEVTAHRVLEAITTEKCNERFSLERLEVLGDAFLKFAVARHFFLQNHALDEGQLTGKRSSVVNNSSLLKLAIKRNIQVYIRDECFNPSQFFALGRPCPLICNEGTETTIHAEGGIHATDAFELRCSKSHHWLYNKTISDVVEALVGAFLVDSGFKAAAAFLRWIGIEVSFDSWQVNDYCTASSRFMPFSTSIDTAVLEMSLGYKFIHQGLLLEAFLHPSYNEIGGGCYQRLEYLGDAVLDYLITSYLYSVYPRLKPGQLTDLRSMYVNNNVFASVAVFRSFHEFFMCDSSALSGAINKYADFIRTLGSDIAFLEGPKFPKALGDLIESSIGAILVDTGFNLNIVWKIMLSFLDPIMRFSSLQLSSIKKLYELSQQHKWKLQFPTFKKGENFIVEAKVAGKDICLGECASSLNKQAAKKMAAEQLCAQLKARGYKCKSEALEAVLTSNCKLEAKLIGYDETPVMVVAPVGMEPGQSNMQTPMANGDDRSPNSNHKATFFPWNKPSRKASPLLEASGSELWATGCSNKSARTRLYQFCAVNQWKTPLFECCKEEGPAHLKVFSFKVVVLMDDGEGVTLECFGEPKMKKVDAKEHSAEGALWYLRHWESDWSKNK